MITPVVCAEHPLRDEGDEIQLWLPADERAAAQARRFVHQRWQQLGEDVLDDIALIVTELVSNAVRHGSPDIVLRMRVDPFAVDVAVLDHGPHLPPQDATMAHVDSQSGRGLSIVEHLARAWGVEPCTDAVGKVVGASISTT